MQEKNIEKYTIGIQLININDHVNHNLVTMLSDNVRTNPKHGTDYKYRSSWLSFLY
jgi:hypothetical protein